MTQQEKLEKMLRDDLWETDDWGTPGPDDVAEYLAPIIEELVGALEAMLRGADLVAAATFDGGQQYPTLMLASAKAQAAITKAEA